MDDAVAKLCQLFEDERHALLCADYSALGDLAARKEQYLSDLTADPPDSTTLTDIKSRLTENQRLISAALRGVAAATERLGALEAVRDGLTTYDPSGKMASITTTQRRFEKKA